MVKDYDVNESLENLTTRENGVIPFAVPFIWGGQEELSIQWRNKLNAPNTGADEAVKFTLLAIGLV
jgi:hypothetical protein